MESRTTTRSRNDNTPEFVDGSPTDRQTTAERSVLFTRVLTGLGVSRQAQRFIWVLYCITKPGKSYQINDYRLAEHLGCADSPTSRNYVCSLRKKLKEWNNGTYNDHGTRHFSFVSIDENTYDFKTKKQNPTGYLVSKQFADMLDTLHAKVKLHPVYKESWPRAISEVCGAAGHTDLVDFGFWNERKQKRPRTPEDILGTLLLNIKRLTKKFIDVSVEFGFSKEETAEKLRVVLPGYVNIAELQTMARAPMIRLKTPGAPVINYRPGMGPVNGKTTHTGPDVPETDEIHDGQGNFISHVEIPASSGDSLRGIRSDFNIVFDKVFKYVSERDGKPDIPVAVAYKSKSRQGDFENVSSSTQQFIDNQGRGDPGENGSGSVKLVDREHIPILQTGKDHDALDNSRLRFLERMQKGSGDDRK